MPALWRDGYRRGIPNTANGAILDPSCREGVRDERGISSSAAAWVVGHIGEDHGPTVHFEGAVDGVIQFDERRRDFVAKFPELIAQLLASSSPAFRLSSVMTTVRVPT